MHGRDLARAAELTRGKRAMTASRVRIRAWVPLLLIAMRATGAIAFDPLPADARGSTWQLDPSQKGQTDLIAYRTLTRKDFRAKQPPPQARASADRLGAATCSYLVPDQQSLRIRATPRKRKDGSWEYVAKPDQLQFRGGMDRRCSWWNDHQKQLAPDYVLAHEQIHFALTEIHARRLNERGGELVRRMTAVDTDPQHAIAEAEAALNRLLEAESRALLERNDRFDAETSLGYRPTAQQQWRARVEKELRETERFARKGAMQ